MDISEIFNINLIVNIIGFIFILISLFLMISSLRGVIKFTDFFSKIHAISLTESIGLPCFIIGVALVYNGLLIVKVKLMLLIIIIWLFSPIATSVLAKAAYKKMIKGKKDE